LGQAKSMNYYKDLRQKVLNINWNIAYDKIFLNFYTYILHNKILLKLYHYNTTCPFLIVISLNFYICWIISKGIFICLNLPKETGPLSSNLFTWL
jgi:hypothetical protein